MAEYRLQSATGATYIINPNTNSTSLGEVSAFGRGLINDIDASAARSRLGAQSKSFVTIGTSNADYICTGTADEIIVQQAVNALPATGGRLYFKNGTYNFNIRVTITGKSNLLIEGESKEGVIIKAAQSIYVGGPDHHYGMFSVRSHTGTVRNVEFRNLTIDANNKLKTQCITVTGGSGGSAATKNVRLRHLLLKNMGLDATDTARGSVEFISGDNGGFGNFGVMDDLLIEDCEFDTSQYYHIYFQGNNFTNVKMLHCYFHDNQSDTINFVQPTFQRTNRNWELAHCRFENTKQRTSVGSVCDFTDSNRSGLFNVRVHDNYFGPRFNPANIDCINVNLHGSWGVEIDNNFFNNEWEPISLGQSLAGSYYKTDPSIMVNIHDNVFYKVIGGCIDNDANFFTRLANNVFLNCGDFCYGQYSRHWPTIIEGNYFYNAGSNNNAVTDYHSAAIEAVGDGLIVRDNVFVDDRLLTDPTTAPTLSQVSGGALSARTYYVKYTWANATGETVASTEANISLSANNLAKITLPTTAYALGTTKINIYISTITNTETLQGYIDVDAQIESGEADWSNLTWTEPTTGLVTGAALPGSNTTKHLMLYGVYEVAGASGPNLANQYSNNLFYGVTTEIVSNSSYNRVRHSNFSNQATASGNEVSLERTSYAQGNVTGATTFNVINGETIAATLTGNITVTLTSGDYKGQRLTLILTQDGTGSRTVSWPGTAKLAQGGFTLATSASAVDVVTFQWDGTNWREVARAPATAPGSSSAITRTVSAISSPATAGATASTDYVYLVSGTTTLTLPTAVSNTNLYTVKNTGSNTVTVATTSSQTIDGSSTITLPVANTAVGLISDGSNWRVI